MMGAGPDDVEFGRQAEKLEGDALRVRLSIDEVLDPPIPKRAFIADPVLRETTIIRAPYQTNFRLSPEQDAAIRGLIARRDPWELAVRLSRELLADRTTFDAAERDYKLEISERVRKAVELARSSSPELADAVRHALGPPNNLLNWRVAASFRVLGGFAAGGGGAGAAGAWRAWIAA